MTALNQPQQSQGQAAMGSSLASMFEAPERPQAGEYKGNLTAVVEVTAFPKPPEAPLIQGKLLFDFGEKKAGDPVLLESHEAKVENFNGILQKSLEIGTTYFCTNSYLDGDTVKVGWLLVAQNQQAINSARNMGKNDINETYSVETGMFTEPEIAFENPTREPHEPRIVKWRLNQKQRTFMTQASGLVTFDQAWLAQKLIDMGRTHQNPLEQIRMGQSRVYDERAMVVRDSNHFRKMLGMIFEGNKNALLRLGELSTGDVFFGYLMFDYKKSVEDNVSKINFEQIMDDIAIPNQTLFEVMDGSHPQINRENYVIEIVATEYMRYDKKSKTKEALVNKITEVLKGKDFFTSSAFGEGDHYRKSVMLISNRTTESGAKYQVPMKGPYAIDYGSYDTAVEIPTPNFAPNHDVRAKRQEEFRQQRIEKGLEKPLPDPVFYTELAGNQAAGHQSQQGVQQTPMQGQPQGQPQPAAPVAPQQGVNSHPQQPPQGQPAQGGMPQTPMGAVQNNGQMPQTEPAQPQQGVQQAPEQMPQTPNQGVSHPQQDQGHSGIPGMDDGHSRDIPF